MHNYREHSLGLDQQETLLGGQREKNYRGHGSQYRVPKSTSSVWKYFTQDYHTGPSEQVRNFSWVYKTPVETSTSKVLYITYEGVTLQCCCLLSPMLMELIGLVILYRVWAQSKHIAVCMASLACSSGSSVRKWALADYYPSSSLITESWRRLKLVPVDIAIVPPTINGSLNLHAGTSHVKLQVIWCNIYHVEPGEQTAKTARLE